MNDYDRRIDDKIKTVAAVASNIATIDGLRYTAANILVGLRKMRNEPTIYPVSIGINGLLHNHISTSIERLVKAKFHRYLYQLLREVELDIELADRRLVTHKDMLQHQLDLLLPDEPIAVMTDREATTRLTADSDRQLRGL